MSVEKMEQYKEYKKHRKEIIRKQKMKERLFATIGIIACIVILGLVGFAIYRDVKPKEAEKHNTSLIDWNKYINEDNKSADKDASTDANAESKSDSAKDTAATDGSANDSSAADQAADGGSASEN